MTDVLDAFRQAGNHISPLRLFSGKIDTGDLLLVQLPVNGLLGGLQFLHPLFFLGDDLLQFPNSVFRRADQRLEIVQLLQRVFLP